MARATPTSDPWPNRCEESPVPDWGVRRPGRVCLGEPLVPVPWERITVITWEAPSTSAAFNSRIEGTPFKRPTPPSSLSCGHDRRILHLNRQRVLTAHCTTKDLVVTSVTGGSSLDSAGKLRLNLSFLVLPLKIHLKT
ncbi:hypothetical protein JEQ12_004935 [Ovis aries]|uniref:Uncharacterized protein n=1 Tax=Ovis aries TaxID=9940 RepID=A0A835ZUP6_SHEEP|nr:hypothetical protein JEQ12_004935 [Ovis aries]